MREFAGYKPPYEMPVFPPVTGVEVLLFVALGLLCGAAAPQFLRAPRSGEGDLPAPSRCRCPSRSRSAGWWSAFCPMWSPEVWGNGYSVVNSVLHSPWTWTALVFVLVFKLCSNRGDGGLGRWSAGFSRQPSLSAQVLGSLFGPGHACVVAARHVGAVRVRDRGHGRVPRGSDAGTVDGDPDDLRDDAFLSGRAAADALVRGAYFVSRAIGKTSMYEITLVRNRDEQERMRLRATQMRELIKPAETIVKPGATVQDMTRVFLEYPVKYLYVTDDTECSSASSR